MKLYSDNHPRLHSLDLLKGIAVSGMILYHFIFDLAYFTSLNVDLTFWPIALLGAIVRLLFIGSFGVTLFLSFEKSQSLKKFVHKSLRRTIFLGLIATLISLLSWLLFPTSFIRFGILHLLAVSGMLAIPFVTKPKISLALGVGISLIGFSFFPLSTQIRHLWWLGFINQQLSDLDYFPLIPWFGIVLIGVWLGSNWHTLIESKIGDFNERKPFEKMAFLGKHSLFVYLIHQPLLILVIQVASYILTLQSR